MKCGILTTVVLAAVAAGTTVGASAQMPGSRFEQSYDRVDIARAIQLESTAEAMKADAGKWNQAAELLREAARLRPGNDPVALADLEVAGLMYNRTQAYLKSHDTLLELAGRASDFGEVRTAAHALIDAAFAAARRGNPEMARGYLASAERLAASSHLSREDQERLAARLHPPGR